MDTLKTLKFVRGAVSTKNLLPEMKHFAIEAGRARAFNGVLALSGPVDMDMDCAPLAAPMIQAISHCDEVVSMVLRKADNKLLVKSGKFSAFIECVELIDLPHPRPAGDMIDVDGAQMLKAITKLFPFIGNDASRPWTNGILLRDQSAFATNNVCLVEYWIGTQLPFTANVPINAIKEMVRIDEPPTRLQLSPHSITFHYDDGRWIMSQLYDTEWPDLRPILDRPSTPVAIDTSMRDAVATLRDFADKSGRLYFEDGVMATSRPAGIGASYEVPGLPSEGIYHVKMLELVMGAASSADFSLYPTPVIFFGDRLRGVIMGQNG